MLQGIRNKFSTLEPLLAARSVAIVGASEDKGRIGGRPIDYMLRNKFNGQILPVNPNRTTVQGLTAYPSIMDLPTVPDVAIVAVSSEKVRQTVVDLGKKGVAGAIIFTSGFAEVGDEGATRQHDVIEAARSGGLRVMGPNCGGLFNGRHGYFATFGASIESCFPLPGSVSIVSQSGAAAAHLAGLAKRRGIGAPLMVTTGNEGDVTASEVLGWLVEDDDTHVICAYLETIRDPETLLESLGTARDAGKPVILMKAGRTQMGTKAAYSHSGALAVDDRVLDAVLHDYGVVRAYSSEQALDFAYAATKRIFPVGNTLGVLTISGGAGVQMADRASELQLSMPEMPADAQSELKAALPYCSPVNPVDCTAQVMNDMELVGKFAESLCRDGGYKSVITFFTQVADAAAVGPGLLKTLSSVREAYPDRLFIASVMVAPEMREQYESAGFLVFEEPVRAVEAASAMGRLGEAFRRRRAEVTSSNSSLQLPRGTMNEVAAKEVLRSIGIKTPKEILIPSERDLDAALDHMNYPLVMKIVSSDIPHKTEVGGISLNVADKSAAKFEYRALLRRVSDNAPNARIDGVLLAEQITGAVECLLATHNDATFGQIILFGLGGVFVEVMKDVSMRRCPIGPEASSEMMSELNGASLLNGYRGMPPADRDQLARIISRLSIFVAEYADAVESLEINPLLVRGSEVYAADALLKLASE